MVNVKENFMSIKPEIEILVNDAFKNLSPYFDLNEIPRLEISIRSLNGKRGQHFHDPNKSRDDQHRLDFDLNVLFTKMIGYGSHLFRNYYLSNTIGEEVGHFLYFAKTDLELLRVFSIEEKALEFIDEVIGHYCGLIYSDKITSGRVEEDFSKQKYFPYVVASKLFLRYRDTKLKELINTNMLDFHDKVKEALSK